MLVFGTRLWFTPRTPLAKPAAVFARWLSQKVDHTIHASELTRGVDRSFPGGHRVFSISALEEYPLVFSATYSHPDSAVDGRRWSTEFGLRKSGVESEIECTVLLQTHETSSRVSAVVSPSRPNFIPRLVEECELSSRTHGVSLKYLESADDFEAFRFVVQDQDRNYPLVVVSPDPKGEYAVAPGELRSLLLGLADVVVIPSNADTYEIARAIGRECCPWGGAVKILYLKVSSRDQTYVPTRTLAPEEIADLRTRGTSLAKEVLSLVAHRTNLPVSLRCITNQSVHETLARRKLAKLRAEAGKSAASNDHVDYIKMLEAINEENVGVILNLKGKNEQLELQNEELAELAEDMADVERRLKSDNERIKAQLSRAERAPRGRNPRDEGRNDDLGKALLEAVTKEPTPTECLVLIEHTFSERVHVLPEAWRSARESEEFKYGKKLFVLLHKLASDYWRLIESGVPDSKAREVFGNSFASKESDTVRKNIGARQRRRFSYQNQTLYMEKHLKIGVKDSASETIRVHFDWVAEEKLIVIGHCGPHLEFY